MDKARYVVGGMVVIGAVASDAELIDLLNKVADEALETAREEAWQAEREADEAREAEEAAREEAEYYARREAEDAAYLARLEAREREAAYDDEADA